ncbi:MAG: holo-[acyl-carrier-protein] synthase [Phycisphaeraceae bacterium]|nr:holo-[acyl-carrier-protein] synthase [Phycisphaeraceae bacterium]
MRILGHGIDIIETARIERLLDRQGEKFLQRCYTKREMVLAEDLKQRVQFLSGRFAAKEAVFKVLGTGLRPGMRWTDAEILRNDAGRPVIELSGASADIAAGLGIDEWWLSISHIASHATASAIGVAGASSE